MPSASAARSDSPGRSVRRSIAVAKDRRDGESQTVLSGELEASANVGLGPGQVAALGVHPALKRGRSRRSERPTPAATRQPASLLPAPARGRVRRSPQAPSRSGRAICRPLLPATKRPLSSPRSTSCRTASRGSPRHPAMPASNTASGLASVPPWMASSCRCAERRSKCATNRGSKAVAPALQASRRTAASGSWSSSSARAACSQRHRRLPCAGDHEQRGQVLRDPRPQRGVLAQLQRLLEIRQRRRVANQTLRRDRARRAARGAPPSPAAPRAHAEAAQQRPSARRGRLRLPRPREGGRLPTDRRRDRSATDARRPSRTRRRPLGESPRPACAPPRGARTEGRRR